MSFFGRELQPVPESTPEQPEEPKRPDVARAFTASVRKSREKKSPSSYLITAGLAVVLAGAVALGVGAIVFHHRSPAKTVNAADRGRSPIGGTPVAPPVNGASPSRPVAGAPVPVPGDPKSDRSHGKGADGKDPVEQKSGHNATDGSSGSSGSSGSGVRAESVASGQSVVGYASGRCIDVTGGSSSGGTPLQIWDCSGASWQKWSFVNGTIRSMGKCMTVAGSSSNGTPIQISGCNGGAAQRFKLNDAHDIVHSGTSECVDVKDQKTGNGTRLQLWKCSGTSNQKWHT
jgi:hypothetical protein